MSEENGKKWVPGTSLTATFAMQRFLKEGNSELATALLLAEVLKGRFITVVNVLSTLTKINEQGIKVLLSEITTGSNATRLAYEWAGFPSDAYPLFSACVDLTQEVVRARKAPPNAQTTAFILEKVLDLPEIRELNINPALIVHLRDFTGSQATQEGPAEPTAEGPLLQ